MKHIVLAAIFLMTSTWGLAQKYAIVDTKYILEHMPEYVQAQKDIDQLSQQWQTEIEQRHETIDRLKKALAAERVLLTGDMVSSREEEIDLREGEARELQRKRFGINGDLFKRRQELIQPIQDMIYEAIAEVADRGGYMVIFDKGISSNVLYVDNRYDLSDRILRRLGIRPGNAPAGGDDEEDDREDTPERGRAGSGSQQRSSGDQPTTQPGQRSPSGGGTPIRGNR